MTSAEPSRRDPADPSALRAALGRFATGVTIITARGFDGAPAGFTANSFNSVSLDPPLILWSLARSSPRLGVYRAAEHYAVNILAAGQADLAARFARRDVDRFAGVAWEEGLGGAPVIGGALAAFECAHEAVYPAGDHELFIGRVMACRAGEGAPLAFFAGRFGSVMEAAEEAGAPAGASAEAPTEALPEALEQAAARLRAKGAASPSPADAAALRALLGRIG